MSLKAVKSGGITIKWGFGVIFQRHGTAFIFPPKGQSANQVNIASSSTWKASAGTHCEHSAPLKRPQNGEFLAILGQYVDGIPLSLQRVLSGPLHQKTGGQILLVHQCDDNHQRHFRQPFGHDRSYPLDPAHAASTCMQLHSEMTTCRFSPFHSCTQRNAMQPYHPSTMRIHLQNPPKPSGFRVVSCGPKICAVPFCDKQPQAKTGTPLGLGGLTFPSAPPAPPCFCHLCLSRAGEEKQYLCG